MGDDSDGNKKRTSNLFGLSLMRNLFWVINLSGFLVIEGDPVAGMVDTVRVYNNVQYFDL